MFMLAPLKRGAEAPGRRAGPRPLHGELGRGWTLRAGKILGMAGEIFFDNSALSRFVDETDADRRTMLDALRRLGTPRISELNVMETARTTDLAVRKRKLEIYKELTGTFAPMNEPVELLAKLANAHLNRSGFKAGSQYAYHLLAHPADASDQLQRALTEWAADQETRFRSLHETMRTHFSGPFEGEATEVMTNEKAFLKYVFEKCQLHSRRPSYWLLSRRDGE